MNTGTLVAEGKTKKIYESATSGGSRRLVVVESKDDLTAGDGAKHDVIAGKAALANRTTCNVFRLLEACGVPGAFVKQIDDTSFYAEHCKMIPLEVVVRREAHGSFLKRHPYLQKGHVFPRLLLEFFLKTSGKKWKGIDIPTDDPFIDKTGQLYLPNKPIWQQEPFLNIGQFFEVGIGYYKPYELGDIALKTFLILEKAWQLLGRKLVDFKVEFGVDSQIRLLVADVIDNDSWRLVEDGQYIDKQVYRDGGDLNTVTEKYRQVTELTSRFHVPRQQVILWRGSDTDDWIPFDDALREYGFVDSEANVKRVTCSGHKKPAEVCDQIAKLVQEIPDSVVIAYVGRSNGLGAILAAQTTVPVISVPSTSKDFPDDVWSSLRLPSSVPAATILDPKNAVLYALQILAMRNPRLYAELRMKREPRLHNFVGL